MNIELFACAGGMAEGFRRAGLGFDLVIDNDPDAIASYTTNIGHEPVRLDVLDFLRMLRGGWRPASRVRLLVADPPCTPWSMAGKRGGLEDERDCLEPTIEIIRVLKPLAYLIGNVPGLEAAPNIGAVHRTIGSLTRAGYCTADACVLNAANYGVPQHRVRPFWFGHLAGACIRWPQPTHGRPNATIAIDGTALEPWRTVRDALRHLPPAELGKPVNLRRRHCNSSQHGSVADAPARVVGTSNLSDGNVLVLEHGEQKRKRKRSPDRRPRASTRDASGDGSTIYWSPDTQDRPSQMHEPAKTVLAAQRGHGGATIIEVPHHPVSEPDELSRTIRASASTTPDKIVDAWPWDAPATTVATTDRIPPPGHHPEEGSILSQPGAIKLTERAAAILQGFPEGWVFCGKTKTARWAQIGQAMPPALAHAVASSIVDWLVLHDASFRGRRALERFVAANPMREEEAG